jgi:hypothetical protein
MKTVLEQVRLTRLWPLGVLLASTIWAGAAVNSQAKLTLEDLVDAIGLSSVDLSLTAASSRSYTRGKSLSCLLRVAGLRN